MRLHGLKKELRLHLKEAIGQCSGLPGVGEDEIQLAPPRDSTHGDLTTNVALLLSGRVGRPPRDIAESICHNLRIDETVIGGVMVAGPGFINFTFGRELLHQFLLDIEMAGDTYGRCDLGEGRKVQVEFVSSNPTGPLTVGHGRQAVLGDALSNLLQWAGYDVIREYYFNDAGNQMDLLGRSVWSRYQQLYDPDVPLLEGGYKGDYIIDIARELQRERGDEFKARSDEGSLAFFREFAVRRIIKIIDRDLRDFGIRFDSWFNESTLLAQGKVEQTIDLLRRKGYVYRHDGAVWFRSSALGDEKDRVLVKRTGEPTYLASDVAYHLDKRSRGFDLVIDIWGADHHGHIPRMMAAMKALDCPDDFLTYLVHQMVSFKRCGREVKMSTRKGEFVTLRELMDEVGTDVARFFYLMRRADSHLVFDFDLAKEESDENPAYYVQYAHARICSLLSFARDRELTISPGKEVNLNLLNSEAEIDLIKKLIQFPELVEGAAKALEPHRIPRYLQELATAFHLFYHDHRVVTEDRELTEARLFLVTVTLIVVKNALEIIGVSAPEKM